MQTIEEMQAIRRRLAQIESTTEALVKARAELAFCNANKKNAIWKASFEMRKTDYYNQTTHLTIDVPFGVIQQQCVDRVARLEREIIQLGGSLK